MKDALSRLRRAAPWRRLARQVDLAVVVALFALVLLLFGFVELADEVSTSGGRFEDELMLALRRRGQLDQPIGPPWVQNAWMDLTALGGPTIVTLITTIVVGYLAMLREWRTALVVTALVVLATLSQSFLKEVFDRPRPDIVPHWVEATSFSFPSGHSLVSAVVYPTLGTLVTRLVKHRLLKVYFLSVALLLMVLVGVSRVYLGVHYPSDVLAGWMLGLGWGIVGWLVLRALQRRHVVEPPGVPPDGGAAERPTVGGVQG